MADGPTTRFKVDVTERDIARAHKDDSYKCVVAQAIARTVPDATRIEVDVQSIRFTTGDGERRIYMTPYVVAGYVVAFDAGDPIEPFSFQLRDPKRVARKLKTTTGKAADRAYRRAKAKPDSKPSTKVAKGSVATSVDAPDDDPKAAYAEVASKATEPMYASDRGGPKPPPRVFKTKRRTYGHRLLRVNREATPE